MTCRRSLPPFLVSLLLLVSTSALAQSTEPAESSTGAAEPGVVDSGSTSDTVPSAPVAVATPVVEKATPVAESVAIVDDAPPEEKDISIQTAWNKKHANTPTGKYWDMQIGGYIRVLYSHIQNDPKAPGVGTKDGFGLGNARVTFQGSFLKTIKYKMQIEGVIGQPGGHLAAELKDAWIGYSPFPFIGLRAGKFNPPFNQELLTSDTSLLFVNRSLAHGGLGSLEGRKFPKMGTDRELGIELGASNFYPMSEGNKPKGFGLSYKFALNNGDRGARWKINKDSTLAYYGRLELLWDKMVRIGGAAGYHKWKTTTAVGSVSTSETKSELDITVDLRASLFGATLEGAWLQKKTTHFEPTKTESTANAFYVAAAYKEPFLGFQPAVRFAHLWTGKQNASDPDNTRSAITLGISYAPKWPIKAQLNYTINLESGDKISNNRFDALLQTEW